MDSEDLPADPVLLTEAASDVDVADVDTAATSVG